MKTAIRIARLIFVGALFGLSFVCIPVPDSFGVLPVIILASLFILVGVILWNSDAQRAWLWYGVAIFGSWQFAAQWFWWGAMEHGWWFPTAPPIIQQFTFIDGETSYDADVGNLTIILWLCASAWLSLHLWKGRARKRNRLNRLGTGA